MNGRNFLQQRLAAAHALRAVKNMAERAQAITLNKQSYKKVAWE